MSNEAKVQIANTILAQMGGQGRLVAMINIRNLVALDSGLQFHFSGSRKATVARVELEANDTYTLKLYKPTMRPSSWEPVNTIPGLYADKLIEVFERETGVRLSL